MAAPMTAPKNRYAVVGEITTGEHNNFLTGQTPILPSIRSLLGFKGKMVTKDVEAMVPAATIASKRQGRLQMCNKPIQEIEVPSKRSQGLFYKLESSDEM